MFRVITVAREFGSGGSIIARKVAEKLRWNLLDRSLITAVARAAQVDAGTAEQYDEHVESWWHRFNQGGIWSAAIFAGIAPDDAQFFDAETRRCLRGGHAEGRRKRRLRDRRPRCPMRVAGS